MNKFLPNNNKVHVVFGELQALDLLGITIHFESSYQFIGLWLDGFTGLKEAQTLAIINVDKAKDTVELRKCHHFLVI